MSSATDKYNEFLKQSQKDIIEALGRSGSFDGMDVIMLHELNDTLKHIGSLLALIADELHDRGGSQ